MKVLMLACCLATGPLQAADSDSLRVAPNFHTPASDPRLRYSLGSFTLRDTVGSRPAGYLAVALNPGTHWYAPPTRFDAILGGAGAATSLGMFIGAVGTTPGYAAPSR
jgi:hypothetical protein